MLPPLWAAISPTLLVIVGVVVVLALGLIAAGLVSGRRAARLRPVAPASLEIRIAAKPLIFGGPLVGPESGRGSDPGRTPGGTTQPSLPEPARPKVAPKPVPATEAEKKEAYRLKKEAESRERERHRQEEQDKADRAAAEALRQKQEAERSLAEAKADAERKVQAQAGRTLADGLAKTRGGFMSRLNGLLGGARSGGLDDQLLAELEEVLFSADIGVKTASQLLDVARTKLKRGELSNPEAVKGAIRDEIERIVVAANGGPAGAPANGPAANAPALEVWMVVGVNGAGKTTTIGKLAAQLTKQGRKVVLGAADTFRAAATDQLEVWAARSGATLVKGSEGSDPGAVAFEAVKRARELGASHVLIDTAGRLHTKAPLMEELKKAKRVLQKAEPGAPHQILLVLDATNGQNAIAQARQFHDALQVSALALTKLDGTAKGGVVIGISDELKLPVRYVGIGETVDDLQLFEPHAFVEALFG